MWINGMMDSGHRYFNSDHVEEVQTLWRKNGHFAILKFKSNRPDIEIQVRGTFELEQTIIPANPGFTALEVFRDAGKIASENLGRLAVIAWGIVPNSIGVNAFSADGIVSGFYGILQPDGRVIDMDSTWDNEAEWIAHLNEDGDSSANEDVA